MKKMATILTALTIVISSWTRCSAWSDEAIADAIYKAENSKTYPYGIVSIDTNGDEEYARKICLNTIRNNRKRFADYGYKQFDSYLEFLASRYCPIGASNDPTGLNVNWLGNVNWFLNHKGERNEI